jgi:hypothetical protein
MVEPQVLAYLQAWKQKNPGIEWGMALVKTRAIFESA